MKITFYIPTLNSEKTLEKSIKSILKQKEKSKIAIVDGGSADKTLKIAKKYKLKVIKQNEKGLANARNIAIKDCRTDLIAFVDSDCYIEKDWSKILIKYFKDKKIAGVCGKLIEKNTVNIADKWRKFHLKQDWGAKKIEPLFLFGSNSIFRLSALKKIKGYDEKYLTNYEDVNISKRLKKQDYILIYDPKAKAYHIREDNISSILKTTRNWSFHSYPIPDNLKNLILRILIYNVHFFLKYLLKEIRRLRLDLLPLNILQLIYNQAYDIRYYKNETKK